MKDERGTGSFIVHPSAFIVQVVVVTGGVSGMVVVPGWAGGVTGSYGAAVPSAPVDGSGGASPPPCAAGVWVALCAGCVIAGGWF